MEAKARGGDSSREKSASNTERTRNSRDPSDSGIEELSEADVKHVAGGRGRLAREASFSMHTSFQKPSPSLQNSQPAPWLPACVHTA